MDEVAEKLAKLRKRKKMSQSALAEAAGVSQATISRIEKQEQQANLKTLAKLARGLKVDLTEFVPREFLTPDDEHDAFYSFCANPFCRRNTLKRTSDGEAAVIWDSGQMHGSETWADVNFCHACGEDLIKGCPSCGMRLREKSSRYCVRCGTQLTDRPTSKEWKRIHSRLGGPDDFDDDIPF